MNFPFNLFCTLNIILAKGNIYLESGVKHHKKTNMFLYDCKPECWNLWQSQ